MSLKALKCSKKGMQWRTMTTAAWVIGLADVNNRTGDNHMQQHEDGRGQIENDENTGGGCARASGGHEHELRTDRTNAVAQCMFRDQICDSQRKIDVMDQIS